MTSSGRRPESVVRASAAPSLRSVGTGGPVRDGLRPVLQFKRRAASALDLDESTWPLRQAACSFPGQACWVGIHSVAGDAMAAAEGASVDHPSNPRAATTAEPTPFQPTDERSGPARLVDLPVPASKYAVSELVPVDFSWTGQGEFVRQSPGSAHVMFAVVEPPLTGPCR